MPYRSLPVGCITPSRTPPSTNSFVPVMNLRLSFAKNSVGVYRETIRPSSDAPVAYTQIAVN